MIRVFDPPRTLEYDWVSDYETTVVRYELCEVQAGTQLVLSERLLTDVGVERRGAGWHHHLERLAAHLGGEASPASEERWRALRELYRSRIAEL